MVSPGPDDAPPFREGRAVPCLALTLLGGGARGAYQAGVLERLGEALPGLEFSILSGVSAGAINAAYLANSTGTFAQAAAALRALWAGLRMEQVVRAAIEEDVDVIGVSILSGAHDVFLPRIRNLLDQQGGERILLIAGGVIPQEDLPQLERQGVARVFLSSTPVHEIVRYLQQLFATPSDASR